MGYKRDIIPDAPMPVSMLPGIVSVADTPKGAILYLVLPANTPGKRCRKITAGELAQVVMNLVPYGGIPGAKIVDHTIGSSSLVDGSVIERVLGNDSVSSDKLQDGSVYPLALQNNIVFPWKINNLSRPFIPTITTQGGSWGGTGPYDDILVATLSSPLTSSQANVDVVWDFTLSARFSVPQSTNTTLYHLDLIFEIDDGSATPTRWRRPIYWKTGDYITKRMAVKSRSNSNYKMYIGMPTGTATTPTSFVVEQVEVDGHCSAPVVTDNGEYIPPSSTP